jgi:hypothetical protein
MKPELAEQNLQLIRTLMERSTIYRRALAPMMLLAGICATVAAPIGWAWHGMEGHMSDREFILFWLIVCSVTLTGAVLLARRQAIRDREPFWSPPLRRVTQAMLPALAVAVAWTVHALTAAEIQTHCVVVWSVFYGCALHAAGMFAPRTLRRAGWLFIAAGLAIGLFGRHVNSSPNVWMGLVFGGLHLVGALYLFATEKKKT